MKKCKTCGIEKDESEFFKKKERWLQGTCKECKRKKILDQIALDPEKHREKERLRSEQRRQTQEWKEWRKDHQLRKRKEISEKSLADYYDKNRLEKQKIWKSNNKERLREYTRTARQRYPFKAAARSYVCAAIKEGIISRPDKCIRCFKECKPEAHHEDYMKPLDVIWLCRSCHGKEHRKHKDDYDCGSSSRHDIHLHREKGEEVNSFSKRGCFNEF
jgi:hypothetical protein